MARILLADDHELIRRGLRSLIEANKDWLICGGLQAARQIRERAPKTKILILSMHDSPQLANEAVRLGADAYLVKSGAQAQLLETIAGLVQRQRI
jgi:DNA-binding NarL/FixJ family response regulator